MAFDHAAHQFNTGVVKDGDEIGVAVVGFGDKKAVFITVTTQVEGISAKLIHRDPLRVECESCLLSYGVCLSFVRFFSIAHALTLCPHNRGKAKSG